MYKGKQGKQKKIKKDRQKIDTETDKWNATI